MLGTQQRGRAEMLGLSFRNPTCCHGRNGREGGIPTHAKPCYPTLSAVTKSLYL